MYYTLTLNPAIDYVVESGDFALCRVNTYKNERVFPGGKGINVSILLSRLNVENIALGICAGFTGDEILRLLHKEGVRSNFVKAVAGYSRINLKVATDSKETELNGAGPEVTSDELSRLYEKLKGLKSGDIIILGGSVPKSLPCDLYEIIARTVTEAGAKFAADTEDLLPLLKYRPLLVKPNRQELEKIFDVKIECPTDAEKYGRELFIRGAENVLVSLGEAGAVLVNSNESLFCSAIEGKVVSACGAGDSMLAGFLYGIGSGSENALLWGTAAGAATAFTKGVAGKNEVEMYRRRLKSDSVRKIK